ncbi:hypothetical protein AAFF_G00342150 [Aldrovandia affinis]|uniref:Uncharacterized protein n=1 Tax=Aldrovandia affinis TaxID=143900 RepID=A0AAD7R658_9TELE|nr:hypothetical protein AAFF_G00342150 [Aldrovandia affinis]
MPAPCRLDREAGCGTVPRLSFPSRSVRNRFPSSELPIFTKQCDITRLHVSTLHLPSLERETEQNVAPLRARTLPGVKDVRCCRNVAARGRKDRSISVGACSERSHS